MVELEKRYDQLVAAGDLSLAGMKNLDKMFSNLRVEDKVEIDALSRQELMEKYSYVWHGEPSIDYEYLFLSDADKAKKDYIYYRFEALMAEEPIDFRDPAFTEKYIAHINATGKNPFTGEPVSSDVKFMAKHYNTVQAWSTLVASLAGGYMDYSDLTSSSGLGSLSDDIGEVNSQIGFSKKTVPKVAERVEGFNSTTASAKQKGNYGEIMADAHLSKPIQGDGVHYDLRRVGREVPQDINAKTAKGIDGIYINESGHPKVVIDEAKYGTSKLNPKTADGKQMSQEWIKIKLNDFENPEDYFTVLDAIESSDYDSVLSKVDADGNVNHFRLDDDANIIGEWP